VDDLARAAGTREAISLSSGGICGVLSRGAQARARLVNKFIYIFAQPPRALKSAWRNALQKLHHRTARVFFGFAFICINRDRTSPLAAWVLILKFNFH